MAQNATTKRHLRVDRFHRAAPYKSKRKGTSQHVPARGDFKDHGKSLQDDVQKIQDDYVALSQSWEGREDVQSKGISIELESAPDVSIDIARLEENGWQLLNE